MRIILIRHGETDWNRMGKIQGISDIPLNENGLVQAKAFAKRLGRAEYNIKAIYSSPLIRALQTAEEVSNEHNLPVYIKDGLKELCFGAYEGLSWSEVFEKYPDDYAAFDKNRYDIPPKDGETYLHRSIEALKSLKEIVRENGGPDSENDVLCVTHSATFKSILCPIKQVPFNLMLKAFPIKNLEEYVLEKEDVEYLMNIEMGK